MRTLAIVAAATVWLAAPAMAATVTYQDRATFEAALLSFDVEDLNSATIGNLSANEEVSFDDFAFTTYNGPGTSFESGDQAFNIDGTTFFSGFGPAGAQLTFDLEVPVTAFGLDLFGVNNFIERTQLVINGEAISMPIADNSVSVSFFGVTTMSPFDQVIIRMLDGEDASFDNVTYGQADVTAAVPVPAAAFLVAPALLLLRRRTKG